MDAKCEGHLLDVTALVDPLQLSTAMSLRLVYRME